MTHHPPKEKLMSEEVRDAAQTTPLATRLAALEPMSLRAT